MNREKLPLSSIVVSDRQRSDLGDIASLADSLRQHGLIQPIVVNQQNRLIAGGRRLAAATSLGWTEVDVVRKETLSEDDLGVLELEENIRRKDISWQERVIAIAKIHRLKFSSDPEWGQRQTGEMLGIAVGNVNYCLRIAEWLKNPEHEAWQCDGINDAWRRCWLKPQEDAALAELARRAQEQANEPFLSDEPAFVPDPSILAASFADAPAEVIKTSGLSRDELLAQVRKDEEERYYRNPHNPPNSFEEYWQGRQQKLIDRMNTINLSNRIVCGDCIAWMNEHPAAVDHIITDIPYAIDLEMIDQDGYRFEGIEDVREEHDVAYNLTLIQGFFKAAFACVREKGYLITTIDLTGDPNQNKKHANCNTLWELLVRSALDAGWRVQRWPCIWEKTGSSLNQMAAYNTTKDYEPVMVCAKPGTTLMTPCSTSIIRADNREAVALTGHPFAKPFELTKFFVDAISVPSSTILDPFAGRGSMVLEFIKNNRHFFAIEKKVEHFNALSENIKQHYLKLNPNFRFV